ncbi:MAG: ATP-binding protein [Gemmataceae bacterium]
MNQVKQTPLRMYPGRLLVASTVSSLFVFLICGLVAGYLYLDQYSTAETLSENIGSRTAAVNLEETINNLIAFLNQGSDKVEPLHNRVKANLSDIENHADKDRERELADRIRKEFDRYLELWNKQKSLFELSDYLHYNVLNSVAELRHYNGYEMKVSEEKHNLSVRRMVWGLITVGGLGSFAGLVFGFGLARSLRRAVQQFLIRIQVASDLLSQQVPTVKVEGLGEPHWDGADDLMKQVEATVRRLNDQEREVRRSERLAAVGQWAAGVAHEVRNPLTSAILLLETARMDPDVNLTDEDIDLIIQELHRIESTLQIFLNFSKPPVLEQKECDLRNIVSDAIAVSRGRIAQSRVNVSIDAADTPFRIFGDPALLGQVILNLILNAVEAMPQGGQLTFRIQNDKVDHTIRLTVEDTGSGISADILPRLFEPFATGKETGTGLGLVVSKRVIEDHNGTLQGFNRPEGGACFVIRLPELHAFAMTSDRSI